MENIKVKTPLWVKLILILLVLQNLLLLGFGWLLYQRLEQRFDTLDADLSNTQNIVGESITSVSQEVESVLTQQASLVSDFYYTLQPAPLGKVLLTLSAQLKNYTAGSAASFSVTQDNGATSLVKTNLANNVLQAEVTLPACDLVSVGLVITDNQNTQSQSLAEIRNIGDCLTDHLFLTPDIVLKQQGADLYLSGSISLINEFGSLEEQQLDMVRLEIRQGDSLLHTFYFSQNFDVPYVEGQQQHILLFEKIKTNARSSEDIIFYVRARDKGGFEYLSACAEMQMDASGLASQPVALDCEFDIVE